MAAAMLGIRRAAPYWTALHRAALLAVMALVVAGPAAGQAADLRNGEQLARRWCAACHLVGSGPAVAVPNAAPPFAVAARERTPEQLKGFLAAPHGAMPNLSLSRGEIDDLVAYILSQR